MRRHRIPWSNPRAGASRGRALVALSLLGLACASRGDAPAPDLPLEPRDLAAHASEFHCAYARWPRDVAELEAFPTPAMPRTRLAPTSGAVPWPLLADAELLPEPDGALDIRAELPPGRVEGQHPDRPVALQLRVEPPGCWPPQGVAAGLASP